MSGKKSAKVSLVEAAPPSAKKGLLAFFSSNRPTKAPDSSTKGEQENPEEDSTSQTSNEIPVITIPETPFVKDVKLGSDNQENYSVISLLNTPKESIQESPNDVTASLSEPVAKKLVFPLFQPGFKSTLKTPKAKNKDSEETNSSPEIVIVQSVVETTPEKNSSEFESEVLEGPSTQMDDEIAEKTSECGNTILEDEHSAAAIDNNNNEETQDESNETEEEKNVEEEEMSGLRRSSRIRHKVNVVMTEIDSDDSDFGGPRQSKRSRHSLSKEEEEQEREVREREKEAKREAKRLQKEAKEKEKEAKVAAMFLSKEQRQQRKQEERERKLQEELLEKERKFREEKEAREKFLLEQAKEREKRIQESILREKQLNDTMLNAKRSSSTNSNSNQSVDLTETKAFFAARTSSQSKTSANNSSSGNRESSSQNQLSATEGEDIWEAYRIVHSANLQKDSWNNKIEHDLNDTNHTVTLNNRDTPLIHSTQVDHQVDLVSSGDTVDLTDEVCHTSPSLSTTRDTPTEGDTSAELGVFASVGDTAALHTLWLDYCAENLPRHTTPKTLLCAEKLSCVPQIWDTAVTQVLETHSSHDVQLFVRWLKLKRDELIQRLGLENSNNSSQNKKNSSSKKRGSDVRGGAQRGRATRRKLKYDDSDEEEDFDEIESDNDDTFDTLEVEDDRDVRGRNRGRRGRVESDSEEEDEEVRVFSRLRKGSGGSRRMSRDTSNSSDEEFDCDTPHQRSTRHNSSSSQDKQTETDKSENEKGQTDNLFSFKDHSGHDTCVPDSDLCEDNVFVLVGVTGSGKSSVAHRVVRHLGFTRVIEINNTVCRTPAAVKRQLLETAAAVPSINYNNSVVNVSENIGDTDNLVSLCPNVTLNGSDSDHSDKFASFGLGVIVVDEADLLLESEEQSLHTTLLKHIQQAKCPVILTCETLPRSLMGLLAVTQIHTRDTGNSSATQGRERGRGWDTTDGEGGVVTCHRNVANVSRVSQETVTQIVRHATHLLTTNSVIVCRDTISWLNDFVSRTLSSVCHGDLRVAMTLLQQLLTHITVSRHSQREGNTVTIDISDDKNSDKMDNNNNSIVIDVDDTDINDNNNNNNNDKDTNDIVDEEEKSETSAAMCRWTQYIASRSYCDFAVYDTLSHTNTDVNDTDNQDTKEAQLCLIVSPVISQIHPVAVAVSCDTSSNGNSVCRDTRQEVTVEVQIEGKHFLHRDTSSSSVAQLEIFIGTQRAANVVCVSDECLTANLTVSQIHSLGPGCHRVSIHLCREVVPSNNDDAVRSVSRHRSDCVFTVIASSAANAAGDTVVTPLSMATLQTHFQTATRSFALFKQQFCGATHTQGNGQSHSARKRKRRATAATHKKNKRFRNNAVNNLQRHREELFNNETADDTELMDTDTDTDNDEEEDEEVQDSGEEEEEGFEGKDSQMDNEDNDSDSDSEDDGEEDQGSDKEVEQDTHDTRDTINDRDMDTGDNIVDQDTATAVTPASQESLSAMLLQAETQRHLLLTTLLQLSHSNSNSRVATQSLKECFDRDTLPQIVETRDIHGDVSWLESRHSALDLLSQVDVLQTQTVSRHTFVEEDDTEVSYETHTPGRRDTFSSVSRQCHDDTSNNRSVFVSSCVAECVARHVRQTAAKNAVKNSECKTPSMHFQQLVSRVAEHSQMFRDTLRRNAKLTSLVTQQYVCPALWATTQRQIWRHRLSGGETRCRVELLPCVAVWAEAARQMETQIATQVMIQRVSRHSSRRSFVATHEDTDASSTTRFPYQRVRDTLYLCSARDTVVCIALGHIKQLCRDTTWQEKLIEALFGRDTIEF